MRFKKTFAIFLTVLGLTATNPGVLAQGNLIPPGAVWKYLDTGANLEAVAWQTAAFNDAGWASGPAQLGYGDSDEATTVGFGTDANAKHITTYFRRALILTNTTQITALNLRVQRDDGIVVYLNGTEVFRENMPAGAITATTLASAAAGDDGAGFLAASSVSPGLLVVGTNIVAAEIHQSAANSSDISFDLELSRGANLLPTVALTSPAEGANFSTGVSIVLAAEAADLEGVSKVEFFANDQSIGVDAVAPYGFTWSNPTDGAHSLTAVVTDTDGATVTSAAVLVTVTDPTPPRLTGVSATTNSVTVVFSKRVVLPGALDTGNYQISNGALVNSAAYGTSPSSNTIVLGTSPLAPGSTYTLTVNNLQDALGQSMAPNSQTNFSVISLTTASIGAVSPASTFANVAGGFNVSAGGADIGGTSDQFAFVYQTVIGNFDFKVRLQSLSLADVWSKGGLMARENLTVGSMFAAAFGSPSGVGSYFQSRATTAAAATSGGSFPANYPNTWLRLQRTNNLFTGLASFDGENWSQLGSATINMSASVLLGLAVSSHTNGVLASAQFRDFQVVSGGSIGTVRLDLEPAGPSSRKTPLAITEIHYNPAPRPDSNVVEFIELYNSNPFFEDISGYRITGAIDYTFPEGTTLAAGAYLVIARDVNGLRNAYGTTNVMGPYANTLQSSSTVRLRNKEGFVLLEVSYSNQPPWPVAADGAGHSLVLARPSYGENFVQAWAASDRVGGSPGGVDGLTVTAQRNVVINEFLASSVAPTEDFIELYNHANQAVDLSGCTLSDEATTNKFVLPNGTSIPARGFKIFHQSELGFGLSSGGEAIYLRTADGLRMLDAIRFEAQAPGVTSGRWPDGAKEFYPLAEATPGTNNSAVLVHDIVINELMYKPISGDRDDEFVELYNQGTNPVSLAHWRFTAGISFTFPSNVVLAANSYLVIARNAERLLTNYPGLTATNTLGNFSGSLPNQGGRVALAKPSPTVTTNNAGVAQTNIVYVTVDEVTYGTGGNWPTWANEGGSSLELIDARGNHRLAHNWGDSDTPTNVPWTTLQFTGPMEHGAQTASHFEVLALGEGEYLLDNAEVLSASGVNLIAAANSTFDGGLGGWLNRGTQIRSSLEAGTGFGGGNCLHVRASARGDAIANRNLVPLTVTPSGNVTLRAKVKWLRGFPELLIRLHGNFAEATDRLLIPTNLGTPGARNSRAANAAPALYEVAHHPVLPAANQPVVVTARVSDPDGVAALTLRYRPDTTSSQASVAMNDSGTGGDAIANDGIFSGTIPGQNANIMIAFQVVATDTASRTNLFPLPNASYVRPFECLVRFGDPVIASGFGTYRQWYTVDNASDWSTGSRPVLSNERIFGTFVYGNFRAVYNTSGKYTGSPYHQGFASPVTSACHYSLELPLDDQVLGTENFNKIHAPGNDAFGDAANQREQAAYWLARQLGLSYNYRRFINMFVNGNRRGGTTHLMEDTETPGSDVINSRYPDDSDGSLFKLQPWFEQADVATGASGTVNNQSWCTLTKFRGADGQHKRARYRWNYLVRAAQGTANDFSKVYELIDTAGSAVTGTPAFTTAIQGLIDVEQWMRTFSVVHSVGDWDHFGFRNAQNMYGYKPERSRWQLLIWDMNIVFDGGADGAGANLFQANQSAPGDPILQSFYNHPPFRRMYLRSLKELANGAFVPANMNPMLDAKYNALLASGITPASPAAIKTYVANARASILTQVAAEDAAVFKITGNNNLTTSNNLVLISGEAPVQVRTIRINGVEYPIVWTSAKAFTIQVPVNMANNVLALQGFDQTGQPISGFSTNVSVNFTGSVVAPEQALVINEIMYRPAVHQASFVEILNNSNFSFDLSGWRVNGIDYTFPEGSIITNRQHLLLAENRGALLSAHGTNPVIFAEFNGALDNGGETISLERPLPPVFTTNGATITTNIVYLAVDKVRYDDGAPWPGRADGTGASLQLIDPNQDNARVSNWAAGGSWISVTRTGNILNGTNLFFYLTTAGSCYLDDVSLTDSNGVNIVINGGFETGSVAPWIKAPNYSGSEVVEGISRTGNRSLLVAGAAAGSASLANSIQQIIGANVSASNVYTLTYHVLYNTNSVTMTMRTLPGNNLNIQGTAAAVLATPASTNLFAMTLPAYDTLWINELQPNNLTGLTDNFGEREPWIELYNAGTNTLDLSGYFLADNFTNLTQWAFPANTLLAPGSFQLVWADAQPEQADGPALHANFRLNTATGSVALVRMFAGAPQITDYLHYNGIAPDLSYGDFPDGQPFDRQVFFTITPRTNNVAKSVNVFVNEWMASNTNALADPADGDFEDWFELYNAGDTAVALDGYYLTDNLFNPTQFKIPTGYTIPPHGFLLVWADNEDGQNHTNRIDLHVDFRLSGGGDTIGLYAPNGFTPIDTISFGNQTNDLSEGRFADGAATRYFMTAATPRGPNTIGQANTAPTLAPLPNLTIRLGQTATVTAVASDADFPAQTFSYGLEPGFPAGATIGSSSGQFLWTPTALQAPSTNTITVRVSDSGSPALDATRSFTVIVRLPPLAGISNNGSGQVSIGFDTIPGRTYRIEWKHNLDDPFWTQLGGNQMATGESLIVLDNIGTNPQRFYRKRPVECHG